MSARAKVNCNAVVCVADGLYAEIKVWAGGGGEAHRVRWPAAISPMSWEEEEVTRGRAASEEPLVEREDGAKGRHDEETSLHFA